MRSAGLVFALHMVSLTSARAKHVTAVSKRVRHQSGPEVTSEIDRIAGLPSEASTDAEDYEEKSKRREISGTDIMIVLRGDVSRGFGDSLCATHLYCVYQEHEQRARNELTEEHSSLGHERGRVCAEDSSCGVAVVAIRSWEACGVLRLFQSWRKAVSDSGKDLPATVRTLPPS